MKPEKEFNRTAAIRPAINVTPLIDVLLVLLILFMIISPQRPAKLPVQAPAPAPVGPAPAETLLLTVSPDFTMELNSKPVTIDELMAILPSIMKSRTEEYQSLFIKAPRGMSYGSVVVLIDLARGAGTKTIGLLADEV
jgi:biopolymer transport protein ExbD